jgi:N-terminal domain of galactosyltransferase
MSIPVLVPRRLDHGWRDEIWFQLKSRYWGNMPGLRVIEGFHDDGPFNRSAAINLAANKRYWDDVAIIADSDSFVPAVQLLEAVDKARETGKLVSALTFVCQFDQMFTESFIHDGLVGMQQMRIEHVRTKPIETQSNCIVVPRELWDEIGGFDERFVGWGGEDNAFWRAAEIRRGSVERIPGAAFHLWHPPVSDRNTRMQDPQYLSNLTLANKYMRCKTKQDLRAVQHGRV